MAVALAMPASVQPIGRVLARLDWRADLVTHFQVPALMASIVAAVALWTLGRSRWGAAAMAGLAVIQAAALVRYDLAAPPVAPAPEEKARLKVLSANVLASNREHERLIGLVERERPDVVAVLEFDLRWQGAMGPLRDVYPYWIEIPDGTRGIGLYSRVPIGDDPAPVVVRPLGDGNPALCVSIAFGDGRLNLWVVHPPSPLGPQGRGRGRAELMALAREIASRPGPTLVVGDLNRTEGSPIFADFLRATGLRDSRPGFGRQESWPSWLPMRLPIDHAFLGPELAVVDRRLGPEIGSDHLPMLVEVAPAADSAARISATQRSRSSGSP
ncbi:endonuclease/exonuclease/phosphatase family protein [Tautonia sociabilis]|uniref:Endonuclease/exonuclease/phosphatase domain-containing protein n=1 Tax=Tautonia sociabilis TaxID=2080755 RepID=A0A432MJL2_9BACT|nr:endonuclease/exonuclease/phosphatase family protein [Tautonia sociabilis]RUL87316.1 hypothetical protein TsocGM_13145 [Tautonia sociabilis]